MYVQDIRLNFKAPEVYHGLAEVEGMMRVEEGQIVLEFLTRDAVLGVIKSKTKVLPIPYHQLSEAIFKTNIFTSSFRLQLKSLELVNKFPGSKSGMIKLKVKRRDKAKAREMESYIRLRLSEHRLNVMGGDVDAYLEESPSDPFLGK